MRFCIPLAPDNPPHLHAKLGGKARSLLRLGAAGLATPPAFVVTTELHAALRAAGPRLPPKLTAPDALGTLARAAGALAEAPWPEGFTDELAAALAALAPEADAHFAVRSSASIEDEAGALAPGLFTSRVDVARTDVPAAVRAVLASALAPGVAAYLDERGGAAQVDVAVLIHRFVAGDAAGAVAYEPTTLATPLVEIHAGGGLSAGARAQIADAARTLAAAHGPVEVEWVAHGDRPTFLQLRPYHARPRTAWSGARQLASGGDGPGSPAPSAGGSNRDWRWDAAHNPLPLSPAQAGLVALVDERCRIGIRQQVVDGYLFYAHDGRAPHAEGGIPVTRAPGALRTLQEIAAAMLTDPAPTLEDALTTFATLYEPLYGDVQPAARAARAALPAFLRRHGLDPAPRLPALLSGVASTASDRMRCARALAHATDLERRATALAIYLALFGDEGPRWDVAAPTWREAPAALERLLLGVQLDLPARSTEADAAAAAVRDVLPDDARADWEACLADARDAVAVGEDDDVLYARLQAHVRRALLREGKRLQTSGLLADPEDVFWLPLDDVRADARGDAPLTAAGVARAIVDAFRADEAARASPPPLELSGREPVTAPAYAGEVVRGISGSGGARIGRVRLHGDPSNPPGPTEVLVARTLLPTELPLVAPIAIVVETGGALDHVAAQARERGIPAIVGAAGATQMLRDGDEVLVDADAGLVVRLAPRSV